MDYFTDLNWDFMKKYLAFISLISALLVSGCVMGPGWYKEGISPSDTENILAKCRYDIGIAKVNANDKAELIADCMKYQGYRFRNYSQPY